MLQQHLKAVLKELGLVSIYNSPVDTKLLCIQRFVRMFAYGGSTLILALYLLALGVSKARLGLFMTLTVWGDVIISFFLTLFADALGRRAVLAMGAAMMSASGVVFALSGNYWVLVAASIFGVISPNGNEIGPFKAIEESTLAHLSHADVRGDIYAWYILIGACGSAFGIMTCGQVLQHLESLDGWDNVRAYRVVFMAYAVLGIVKLFLVLALSSDIEAEKEPARIQANEEEPLLGQSQTENMKPKSTILSSIFPRISSESRAITIQLSLLFGLDALASGLASLPWLTVFFKEKFDLSDGSLGSIFFTTSIIAALSTLVAASLARRFGNINTMVFTHLPSSVALALIPLPSNIPLALVFLILRACTQSMDSAPRSAFVAAVILPNERTAVMGTFNVIKSMATSIGPTITGLLDANGRIWVAFVLAGSLKATYDLGLLAVFKGHISREERSKVQNIEEETSREGGEQNGNENEN